jgi:hypothetical protein
MAATSYDGIYKNYNLDLYVWTKIIKNIDGIPIPEVWCIDSIRKSSSNPNNKLQKKN